MKFPRNYFTIRAFPAVRRTHCWLAVGVCVCGVFINTRTIHKGDRASAHARFANTTTCVHVWERACTPSTPRSRNVKYNVCVCVCNQRMFDAGECIIVLVFLCGNYVACVQCSARGTVRHPAGLPGLPMCVCVCAINKVEFPVGPIGQTLDSVLKCLQLTEVFDLTIYVRRLRSDFEDSTT